MSRIKPKKIVKKVIRAIKQRFKRLSPKFKKFHKKQIQKGKRMQRRFK